MDTYKKPIFEMGRPVTTRGAAEAFEPMEIFFMLYRHGQGDWGDTAEADKGLNDLALQTGDRILSVYRWEDGRVAWVITDGADDTGHRCYTTCLLPEEY